MTGELMIGGFTEKHVAIAEDFSRKITTLLRIKGSTPLDYTIQTEEWNSTTTEGLKLSINESQTLEIRLKTRTKI